MNFTGALSSESNSMPVGRTTKRRDHGLHPIRRSVRNGDAETDAGAHRFLARRSAASTISRSSALICSCATSKIDQFHDRRPTFGGLHFREDLAAVSKVAERHAERRRWAFRGM